MVGQRFDILVVCTANICRSPSTVALLRHALRALAADPCLLPVELGSAGVAAVDGRPVCSVSAGLIGEIAGPTWVPEAHRARRVDAELLAAADLVLALDRTHSGALAALSPSARSKVFTLRHAAAVAAALQGLLSAGELPAGAPPVPQAPVPRLRWWVEELHAMRGLAPQPVQDPTSSSHPWDIPDPHEVGMHLHRETVVTIDRCAVGLAAAMVGLAELQ